MAAMYHPADLKTLAGAAMALPTKEEFLKNLYRMKEDCLAFMEEAERRGDTREAGEFKEHLERVESMIEQSGGDPEAGPSQSCEDEA